MENFLKRFYYEKECDPNTLGVLLVEKSPSFNAGTDQFDLVLLAIVKKSKDLQLVKHYEYGSKNVAIYTIEENQLTNWLLTSVNRKIIDWTINGEIKVDRNNITLNLKNRLTDFPLEDRKRKMVVEFIKLIRRFNDGKDLFYSNNYLDSFNNIMHALHHLGRLGLIEHGYYPEVSVWNQLKQIEPEMFKLYNELVTGDESLEKRLELLFIAIEFAITSKTKAGSAYLFEVMNTRTEAWEYKDLLKDLALVAESTELSMLLEHLIQKGYIDIERKESMSKGIYQRLYRYNEKVLEKSK